MEELKRIRKYNNIYYFVDFETLAADVAKVIREGHTVQLLDKRDSKVYNLNKITIEEVIFILGEIEKDAKEAKKREGMFTNGSTSNDRFLCYYITEEEAEPALQAAEQEEEA